MHAAALRSLTHRRHHAGGAAVPGGRQWCVGGHGVERALQRQQVLAGRGSAH